MPKTQQEIIRQGYQALVNSLGVVDAIRFIQHFTPGQGDYTKERHEWLDQTPLEDRCLECQRAKLASPQPKPSCPKRSLKQRDYLSFGELAALKQQ